MTRILSRVLLTLSLAVLVFGEVVPSATAGPERGRFGGCIQACNEFHRACHERVLIGCGELFGREPVVFAACVRDLVLNCNLLAFDCRYNFCLSGDPEPFSLVPRDREEPRVP